MSVYQGPQGKGAQRRHRDDRYRAAVGRQQLMHDRGRTQQRSLLLPGTFTYPAPVEEFLRPGDDPNHTDFRTWAVMS